MAMQELSVLSCLVVIFLITTAFSLFLICSLNNVSPSYTEYYLLCVTDSVWLVVRSLYNLWSYVMPAWVYTFLPALLLCLRGGGNLVFVDQWNIGIMYILYHCLHTTLLMKCYICYFVYRELFSFVVLLSIIFRGYLTPKKLIVSFCLGVLFVSGLY